MVNFFKVGCFFIRWMAFLRPNVAETVFLPEPLSLFRTNKQNSQMEGRHQRTTINYLKAAFLWH